MINENIRRNSIYNKGKCQNYKCIEKSSKIPNG